MNPLILVTYSAPGQKLALDLVEPLGSLGSVILSSYDKLHGAPKPNVQVVVSIVTDDRSCSHAHDLQHSIPDVPVVVVDHTFEYEIPNNGFADRVSADIGRIVASVRTFVEANHEVELNAVRKPTRSQPRTSSFDVTLARFGSGPEQSREGILITCVRHLTWELKAEHAEAFLVDKNGSCKRVFGDEVSDLLVPTFQRRLAKLARPLTRHDLTAKQDQPIRNYLEQRKINLICPLVMSKQLIGWMAYAVDHEIISDEFVDDIQVIAHLISLGLNSVPELPDNPLETWQTAFSVMRKGAMIFDRTGNLITFVGDMSLLGAPPKTGASFKQIRMGHVREVIVEALANRFAPVTWTDPDSGQALTAEATAIPDGTIAISFGPSSTQKSDHVTPIEQLIESLPLPVQIESSGSSSIMPAGKVTSQDSTAIRECASAALARNVKSLRLRYRPGSEQSKAVLFFESKTDLASNQFQQDVNAAVVFSIAHE